MLFHVEHLDIAQSDQAAITLEKLCRTEQVAAFIYEPLIQGAGGMRIYSRETLERLIEICKRYGVICIADEVMTGFGRTGPLFASSVVGIAPEIICISKGLTSGSVPLSATACSEEIFQGFVSRDRAHTFFHGHTYTGNPIAASIALESLKLTLSDECAASRSRIYESHVKCAKELGALPRVSNVRVLGTIIAFDLLAGEGGGYLSSIREEARKFFRSRGVLLRPLGNVVYALPPYCIRDEQLERIHSSMIDFAAGARA
jgi:adenosylmethionine-8-amino-7-oxononanoate aminotransferase